MLIKSEMELRRVFLKTILFLGFGVLFVFSIYYFIQENWLMGRVEMVGAMVLAIGLLWFYRGGFLVPALIGWSSLYLVFSLIIFTGGVAGTGILWWGLMPIIGYLLFGRVRGNVSMGLNMIMIGGVWLLSSLEIVHPYYSGIFLRQLLILLSVEGFIVYVFEQMAERTRILVQEQKDLLISENESRKKTEFALEEKILELTNQQNKQAEIRTAMINLLEDEKELEAELKAQKEGVEKEVAERTAELTAVINSISRGLMVVNGKRKVMLKNNRIDALIKNECGYHEVVDFFGEKVDIENMVNQCFTAQSEVVNEPELYDTKYLKVHVVPVNEGSGMVSAAIFVSDVTESIALQRSRDEFFSIASHELRTPLTAIRGNAEMIIDNYGDKIKEKDVTEMIADIHIASERLITIVNDFLNVSRLELKKMTFKRSEVDLAEIAKSVIKEFEVTSSRQKVQITLKLPSNGVAKVMADPDRMKQVMFNLIGNGLKFTKDGEVVVEMVNSDSEVRVKVSDSGEGIPKEMQGLLFHKFQQAGSSLYTRDTSKGTGLGLYISRLMMDGMDGKIWLEKSELGKGSTFVFCLPIVQTSGKGV